LLIVSGTYLETDFDRSATRDIAVQSRSEPQLEMVRQLSAPAEHDLSDMLRHPSCMDHSYPASRLSHPQNAGHVRQSSPDKMPGLTGGRYPAYAGHTQQPASRSLQSQQPQQWHRHGCYWFKLHFM